MDDYHKSNKKVMQKKKSNILDKEIFVICPLFFCTFFPQSNTKKHMKLDLIMLLYLKHYLHSFPKIIRQLQEKNGWL